MGERNVSETNSAGEETEAVLVRILRREDLISGVSLILIALFFLWTARDYPIGSTAVMGPGYFPRALCIIIMLAGSVILVNGYRAGFPVGEEHERVRILPVLLVPASYIIFALTAQEFGLLLSGAILCLIAAFAYPKRSMVEAVLLTAMLLILSWVLWFAIGIQLPLFPRFL